MSFLDGVVEIDDKDRDRYKGVKTHLGLCLFTISITIEDGLAIVPWPFFNNWKSSTIASMPKNVENMKVRDELIRREKES